MNTQSNFIFFGTPEVARKTLEILSMLGWNPVLVVTKPDAKQGRGLVLTPTPVKLWAEEQMLPVFTPEKLDGEAIATIATYQAQYAIVVAYGKIFPDELIHMFPNGVLNIHYSLLPKYRGATPLEAALRQGESETGVTIQKMVAELDAGDILAQKIIPIGLTDTALDLRPRLIQLGAELLAETLPSFERGESILTPQNPDAVSKSGKLRKQDGLIELGAPTLQNWNIYRAYNDSIGTYFFENGKRMKIMQAILSEGKFVVTRVIPEGKAETTYPLTGSSHEKRS
jgi:methionyl-tRNA formyltransferase